MVIYRYTIKDIMKCTFSKKAFRSILPVRSEPQDQNQEDAVYQTSIYRYACPIDGSEGANGCC